MERDSERHLCLGGVSKARLTCGPLGNNAELAPGRAQTTRGGRVVCVDADHCFSARLPSYAAAVSFSFIYLRGFGYTLGFSFLV